MGKQWKQWQTLFPWAPKSLQMVTSTMQLKDTSSFGRKTVINLDSILKSRDNTLPTNVHLVKAMVFPVMYGCESWTMRKAEHRRIDAFELLCWRRLLRVPWTARRSNQSILKEISPEYSLEGLMLKLKLQYFGHLMQITDSLERPCCWERLRAGWEGDNRGWSDWIASPTRWTWVWASSRSWWGTGKPGVLQYMGSQRVGHDWVAELKWILVACGLTYCAGKKKKKKKNSDIIESSFGQSYSERSCGLSCCSFG